jgi:O-antigen/teichoic acid export membrane protein
VAKSLGVYIRAHKRDPLLVPGLLAILLIGGLVWLLGMRFGAIGAAWGYTFAIALVYFPWWVWLWLHCRREWHA